MVVAACYLGDILEMPDPATIIKLHEAELLLGIVLGQQVESCLSLGAAMRQTHGPRFVSVSRQTTLETLSSSSIIVVLNLLSLSVHLLLRTCVGIISDVWSGIIENEEKHMWFALADKGVVEVNGPCIQSTW